MYDSKVKMISSFPDKIAFTRKLKSIEPSF